jgi:hypothetical protein
MPSEGGSCHDGWVLAVQTVIDPSAGELQTSLGRSEQPRAVARVHAASDWRLCAPSWRRARAGLRDSSAQARAWLDRRRSRWPSDLSKKRLELRALLGLHMLHPCHDPLEVSPKIRETGPVLRRRAESNAVVKYRLPAVELIAPDPGMHVDHDPGHLLPRATSHGTCLSVYLPPRHDDGLVDVLDGGCARVGRVIVDGSSWPPLRPRLARSANETGSQRRERALVEGRLLHGRG